MKEYTLQGNIVFPNEIKLGQIHIADSKIVSIEFNAAQFQNNVQIMDHNKFICPGFIDLQINGAFGKEFKTDSDAINVVSNNLFKFGTTSFCPTVTTRNIDSYAKHLESLISHFNYSGGTKFLGFHLEGPFLNPKMVGAQNSNLLTNPSNINLDWYINDNVKLVTLAPELEGSAKLISDLLQRGIRVGIGHSLINYEELKKIFYPNYMWIVHLFNAMEPFKSREPGVVGFGLNEDVFVGLIVDKIHLHPKTVDVICKLKLNKIIGVTDGSAVTGLKPGTYNIGERSIIKTEERATLPNGTLTGSILTQNIAIKNLMEIHKCNLYEAVKTVSYNPAKFLGLEKEIGQIAIGNYADIVVIDENYNVFKTIINGKIVYEKY